MVQCTRCVVVPSAHAKCWTSCRSTSRLTLPARPVGTNKRKRCQPLTVAHSSVLLPDVSPEANVPPAVVKTIVEYARAMPTWEVFTRAGVEIAVSVFVSVLIVKAIQRATAEAVQVKCPHILTTSGLFHADFATCLQLSRRICYNTSFDLIQSH